MSGQVAHDEGKEVGKRGRGWLALLLLAYTIVTVAYGLVNPLFEAPDEHWHYFTAQYIAEQRALPAVAPGEDYDVWLSQEAAQPPLYYLLSSLLIAPLDTRGARQQVWPNKFADIGDAGALINVNRFVHTDQESWPWNGYALAAHLLRLFSTLLGLGTLQFIYGSGRLLWPGDWRRPLLAVGLVAFLPQYNFLHASVSNDPLIIVLVSAALWQLIRMWQTGVSNRRMLLLGLTTGLAILSKNAGITLLLYAGGFLVLLAWRDWPAAAPGAWRKLAANLALFIAPALLLGGWLWLRNWSLYGDFTATNQFIRLAGGDRGYTLPQVLRETRGLWLSFFAVFGWFNLRPPQWVYWFWGVVALLAGLGGAWGLWQAWRAREAAPAPAASGSLVRRWQALLVRPWVLPALLALWVVGVYASLVFFMLRTEAAQGRLLFPALLPLALGAAYGLSAPPPLRRMTPLIPAAGLSITIYCLFFVIRPAYEKPPLLAELPAEAAVLDVNMGQGLRLLGAALETEKALPGEAVWLTLYWQAGEMVSDDVPELVLSIFGRDEREIGKVHSYHGRGLYPATLWPPRQIVADRFGVRLAADTEAPVMALIDSGLLRGDGPTQAARLKISPPTWPEAAEPLLGTLGTAVGFAAVQVTPPVVRPGGTVNLELQWQALDTPPADFTVLLHLGQPNEPPLATGDRPPLNGDYPTSVWQRGEVINDNLTLQVPEGVAPGRYPVWLGMYDAQSLLRLPVFLKGEEQPFDVYLAGWVEVAE